MKTKIKSKCKTKYPEQSSGCYSTLCCCIFNMLLPIVLVIIILFYFFHLFVSYRSRSLLHLIKRRRRWRKRRIDEDEKFMSDHRSITFDFSCVMLLIVMFVCLYWEWCERVCLCVQWNVLCQQNKNWCDGVSMRAQCTDHTFLIWTCERSYRFWFLFFHFIFLFSFNFKN